MNKAGGQASVPMNLFATWDIDRSASNCIPRICSMTVCKLIVPKELDKDVQSVFIAVKMQGSKRVFRSNEIFMSQNGLCNIKLELTFSLQYPHFVKRNENRLQIMLQRKKRYKNRAMLGYKTLAVGRVDMAQLIQCPMPDESVLDLYTVAKDQDDVSVAAHIVVSNMSSLPIYGDMESERSGKPGGSETLPEVDNDSDEDEETYSSDQDAGSDNLQDFADDESRSQKRKNRRKVRMSSTSRQQNFIKSKVVSLLKKFKQVAEDDLDPGLEQEPGRHPPVPDDDFDFLYDELEDFNLSDSCPEVDDNISIVSTPKPKLRPFFDRLSHSSSQTEINSLKEVTETQKTEDSLPNVGLTDTWDKHISFMPGSDGPDKALAGGSVSSSPETRHVHYQSSVAIQRNRSNSTRPPGSTKQFIELQSNVGRSHSSTDNSISVEIEERLPENIFLLDGTDKHASCLANAFNLQTVGLKPPIITTSRHDLQVFFLDFLSTLQKFLNRNSLSPSSIKIAVIGNDGYLNSVLRQFVDCLSSRSSDWQSYIVFLVIPTSCNRLSRYLCTVDARYNSLFGDSWKECIERLSDFPTPVSEQNPDIRFLVSRIGEYSSEAPHNLQLTIAEAMITFRQSSDDEDSSHKFLPFVSDVRVGDNDMANPVDSDKEDYSAIASATVGSSFSGPSSVIPLSPPSSPSVPSTLVVAAKEAAAANAANSPVEVKLGLQVDYWKERDTGKYTLKTNFKSFLVTRLPLYGDRQPLPGLTLDIVTKGKKNIMRLPGKKGKEKETDSKSQAVGNVNRLICASKHQHNLLQVTIDGVEWNDVKFFQLSSHWSSHVKVLPIAVFTPV